MKTLNWHMIALYVIRAVITCLGMISIYIALFLHEDEEGRLQNRLEELWVTVDDAQNKALSKQAIFLQELVKLLSRGFDALLGKKLFSLRSITVIFCYSWASAVVVDTLAESARTGRQPGNMATAIWEWLEPIIFVVLGTTAARERNKTFAVGSWCFIVGWMANDIWGYGGYSYWFARGVLFGCVCDIFVVGLNRVGFRVANRVDNSVWIILILLLNIGLVSVYAAPVWYWWFVYTTTPLDFYF